MYNEINSGLASCTFEGNAWAHYCLGIATLFMAISVIGSEYLLHLFSTRLQILF